MRRADITRAGVSLIGGLVFGLGLLVSDMANPARVLAFLDVGAIPAGGWDPTLMFVMGGAMAVSSAAWIVSRRRAEAAFGGPLPPMPRAAIDGRLIVGSALFGIGWGLVGVCPGPALAGLALGGGPSFLFLSSMIAGMALFMAMDQRLPGRATADG